LISNFRHDLNILYVLWVFPRRQIVVGRRFGTLCQFHLQRLDVEYEVWEEARYFIPSIEVLTGAGRTNGSGQLQLEPRQGYKIPCFLSHLILSI